MALRSKETTSKEAIITTSDVSIVESSQPDLQNIIISQLRSVIKQLKNN